MPDPLHILLLVCSKISLWFGLLPPFCGEGNRGSENGQDLTKLPVPVSGRELQSYRALSLLVCG